MNNIYNNLNIMSYYILPKKNNILHIISHIKLNNNNNNNYYISHSLFHYLNKQLNEVESLNNDFLKMINPYEFLFSKVPSYKISVSKLKPPSHSFYILM